MAHDLFLEKGADFTIGNPHGSTLLVHIRVRIIHHGKITGGQQHGVQGIAVLIDFIIDDAFLQASRNLFSPQQFRQAPALGRCGMLKHMPQDGIA